MTHSCVAVQSDTSSVPVFVSFRQTPDDFYIDYMNGIKVLIKQYIAQEGSNNQPYVIASSIASHKKWYQSCESIRSSPLYKTLLVIKLEILRISNPSLQKLYRLRWEYFLDVLITRLEQENEVFSTAFDTCYIQGTESQAAIEYCLEEVPLNNNDFSNSFLTSSELSLAVSLSSTHYRQTDVDQVRFNISG